MEFAPNTTSFSPGTRLAASISCVGSRGFKNYCSEKSLGLDSGCRERRKARTALCAGVCGRIFFASSDLFLSTDPTSFAASPSHWTRPEPFRWTQHRQSHPSRLSRHLCQSRHRCCNHWCPNRVPSVVRNCIGAETRRTFDRLLMTLSQSHDGRYIDVWQVRSGACVHWAGVPRCIRWSCTGVCDPTGIIWRHTPGVAS